MTKSEKIKVSVADYSQFGYRIVEILPEYIEKHIADSKMNQPATMQEMRKLYDYIASDITGLDITIDDSFSYFLFDSKDSALMFKLTYGE